MNYQPCRKEEAAFDAAWKKYVAAQDAIVKMEAMAALKPGKKKPELTPDEKLLYQAAQKAKADYLDKKRELAKCRIAHGLPD